MRRFYERAPFPGYPPHDSLHALRARADRSPSRALIDRAIPGNARVVDVGCGTGQMTLFLARADRVVVAADMTRASLALGAAAARRFGLTRVQFVETDLSAPASDPARSTSSIRRASCITRRVRARRSPGSRSWRDRAASSCSASTTPSRACRSELRRVVARASGFRVIPFDPVLRDRESEPARRDAWLRDQYQHPEEHSHTLAEVQRWFAENGVEYLRAYPSALLDDEPEELFAPALDNWRAEGWLAQLGWIRTLGHEGGLFFTVGRRLD